MYPILCSPTTWESVSYGRYAGPVIALGISGILPSQLWLIQSLPAEYFCIPQTRHMKPAHPPAFPPNEPTPGSWLESRSLCISSLSLPSHQLIENPSGFSILAISAPSPSLLSQDYFCLRPHHLCLDLCRSLIIGLLASNESLQSCWSILFKMQTWSYFSQALYPALVPARCTGKLQTPTVNAKCFLISIPQSFFANAEKYLIFPYLLWMKAC